MPKLSNLAAAQVLSYNFYRGPQNSYRISHLAIAFFLLFPSFPSNFWEPKIFMAHAVSQELFPRLPHFHDQKTFPYTSKNWKTSAKIINHFHSPFSYLVFIFYERLHFVRTTTGRLEFQIGTKHPRMQYMSEEVNLFHSFSAFSFISSLDRS